MNTSHEIDFLTATLSSTLLSSATTENHSLPLKSFTLPTSSSASTSAALNTSSYSKTAPNPLLWLPTSHHPKQKPTDTVQLSSTYTPPKKQEEPFIDNFVEDMADLISSQQLLHQNQNNQNNQNQKSPVHEMLVSSKVDRNERKLHVMNNLYSTFTKVNGKSDTARVDSSELSTTPNQIIQSHPISHRARIRGTTTTTTTPPRPSQPLKEAFGTAAGNASFNSEYLFIKGKKKGDEKVKGVDDDDDDDGDIRDSVEAKGEDFGAKSYRAYTPSKSTPSSGSGRSSLRSTSPSNSKNSKAPNFNDTSHTSKHRSHSHSHSHSRVYPFTLPVPSPSLSNFFNPFQTSRTSNNNNDKVGAGNIYHIMNIAYITIEEERRKYIEFIENAELDVSEARELAKNAKSVGCSVIMRGFEGFWRQFVRVGFGLWKVFATRASKIATLRVERARIKEERMLKLKLTLLRIDLRNEGEVGKCFELWWRFVRGKRQRMRVARNVVKRLQAGAVLSAIKAWKEFIARRKIFKKIVLAFGRKANANKKNGKDAFETWKLNTTYVKFKRMQSTIDELESRINLHESQLTNSARTVKHKTLGRFVGRIRLRNVSIAFNLLTSSVTASKRSMISVNNFVVRMRSKSVTSVMKTWLDFTISRKITRRTFLRFSKTNDTRRLTRAFKKLRQVALIHHLIIHNTTLKEEHFKREFERNTEALNRSRAGFVLVQALLRFASNRVKRMGMKSFLKWKELSVTEKRLDLNVCRFHLRLATNTNRRSFLTWHAQTTLKKTLKKTNAVKVTRFKSRRNRVTVCRLFSSWLRYINRYINQRVNSLHVVTLFFKINRLTKTHSKGKLTFGFNSWLAYTLRMKTREHQVALDNVILRRVINRMAYKLLSLSFTLWHTYMQRIKRSSMLLLRYAFKIKKRTTLAVFAMLRRNVSSMGESRRLCFKVLSAVLSRFRKRSMYGGFRVWADFVAAWNGERAEKRRLEVVVKRCLSRIYRRRKCDAMEMWSSYVERRRRVKLICSKFLKRFKNKKVGDYWNNWIAAIERKRREGKRENTVKQCISKIMQRSVALALKAWRDFVSRRNACRNVLKRLGKRRLSVCWKAWVYKVDGAKCEDYRRAVNEKLERLGIKLENAVVRRVAKIRRREAARAVRGWVEFVELRRLSRSLCTTFLKGFENGKLIVVWSTWLNLVNVLKIEDDRIALLAAGVEEKRCNVKRKLRRICERVTGSEKDLFLNRRSLQYGFEVLKHRLFCRSESASKSAYYQEAALKTSELEQLRDERSKRDHQISLVLISKISNRTVARKAMKGWLEFRQTRRWLRGFVERVIGGVNLKDLNAGFRRWFSFVCFVKIQSQTQRIGDLNDVSNEKKRGESSGIEEKRDNVGNKLNDIFNRVTLSEKDILLHRRSLQYGFEVLKRLIPKSESAGKRMDDLEGCASEDSEIIEMQVVQRRVDVKVALKGLFNQVTLSEKDLLLERRSLQIGFEVWRRCLFLARVGVEGGGGLLCEEQFEALEQHYPQQQQHDRNQNQQYSERLRAREQHHPQQHQQQHYENQQEHNSEQLNCSQQQDLPTSPFHQTKSAASLTAADVERIARFMEMFTHAFSTAHELSPLFAITSVSVSHMLGGARGSLFLIDRRKDEVFTVVDQARVERAKLTAGIIGYTASVGESVLCEMIHDGRYDGNIDDLALDCDSCYSVDRNISFESPQKQQQQQQHDVSSPNAKGRYGTIHAKSPLILTAAIRNCEGTVIGVITAVHCADQHGERKLFHKEDCLVMLILAEKLASSIEKVAAKRVLGQANDNLVNCESVLRSAMKGATPTSKLTSTLTPKAGYRTREELGSPAEGRGIIRQLLLDGKR